MARKLRTWRSEIAYGLLATGVILAFVLYQHHVNSQFRQADRFSCQNRETLTANQRLVLSVLYRNTAHLASITQGSVHSYFERTHAQIGDAMVELSGTPSCEDR